MNVTAASAALPFLVDNRNLLFLQRTVSKLNQWLWGGRPVRPLESQLFTPRGRQLSALKRVVAEAAEGGTPQRPAASLGWVNQVFATATVVHGWSLLFRDGLQTDFIAITPPCGQDRLPPLAISTGLFVAVLIEVWEWTLGLDAEPPTGKAPLCRIWCEQDPARVRLEFTPRGQPAAPPSGLFELLVPPPVAGISADFTDGKLVIDIQSVLMHERKPISEQTPMPEDF